MIRSVMITRTQYQTVLWLLFVYLILPLTTKIKLIIAFIALNIQIIEIYYKRIHQLLHHSRTLNMNIDRRPEMKILPFEYWTPPTNVEHLSIWTLNTSSFEQWTPFHLNIEHLTLRTLSTFPFEHLTPYV